MLEFLDENSIDESELNDLLKEYNQLAKAMDQRLVRLEQASKEKGFSSVLNFAYQKAMKSIEKWSGPGANRFNRNTPKTAQGLRGKISDMLRFKEYKSSTKAGIKRTYKDVAKTTNNKYGTNLKWDKLEDLYTSSEWEWLKNKFGSDTAMKIIAQIENNRVYITKMIEEHQQVDFQLENNKVNDGIIEALDKYGLDLVNLY